MGRETAHWRPNAKRAGEILGMLIRDARIQRRQTIEDAAAMCGISPRTMSRLEHGEPTTSISTAFNVADRFGIPLFQLEPAELERLHGVHRQRDALLPRRAVPMEADDDF